MSPGASIRPDPGAARLWVERELSRPAYHESLVNRFLSWLGDLWSSLQARALGATPLSTGAAVLVLVVLVALAVVVAGRVRREPLRTLHPDAGLGTGRVSPQEHRQAAEAARSAGEFHLAIVEAFRAVAARAVERGVLDERPGRTAHELAGDLGPSFPGHTEEFIRASALFDQVFYGDEPAGAADADLVLDLDEALRVARPGMAAHRSTATAPR